MSADLGPLLSRRSFVARAVGAAIVLPRLMASVIPTVASVPFAVPTHAASEPKPMLVYLGTGARGSGVHRLQMDPETGRLTPLDITAIEAPGWIELDRSEQFLFATIAGSKVASFAIDQKTGSLSLIGTQQNGASGAPHLSVDRTGRFVVTASYGGGSVSLLPVAPDGQVGPIADLVLHQGDPGPHRDQSQPRAHQCPFDLTRRWIAVPDLGLDRVYVYRLDGVNAKLVANDPAFIQFERGRGPRHIAFHPNGRFAYLINELNSTMTALAWDSATGVFTELNTLTTLPPGWTGRQWSAQVVVHPNGRFVYGSNRGSGGDSDDIAIFAIDQASGRISPTGHAETLGKVPRNFVIDPSGRFLICAHQDSDNVVPFNINAETGALTPIGQSLPVINAICVQFAPGIA